MNGNHDLKSFDLTLYPTLLDFWVNCIKTVGQIELVLEQETILCQEYLVAETGLYLPQSKCTFYITLP